MQLNNSFTVPATPEAAWNVLLDVPRIAPCMPGAELTARSARRPRSPLTDLPLREEVEQLLAQRDPLYRRAVLASLDPL